MLLVFTAIDVRFSQKYATFARKRLTLMRLRQPQVKKYPFSYLFLATIWILCFCYPPRTPLDNVAFIDKWVHIVMYAGTCTTIWIEYLRHHKTPETMKPFYMGMARPP